MQSSLSWEDVRKILKIEHSGLVHAVYNEEYTLAVIKRMFETDTGRSLFDQFMKERPEGIITFVLGGDQSNSEADDSGAPVDFKVVVGTNLNIVAVDYDGVVSNMSFDRVLVHELVHILGDTEDDYGNYDDWTGETVNLTNDILEEIGGNYPSRASYFSAGLSELNPILAEGNDLSEGRDHNRVAVVPGGIVTETEKFFNAPSITFDKDELIILYELDDESREFIKVNAPDVYEKYYSDKDLGAILDVGPGNDTVHGTEQNNRIHGESGDDFIRGYDGRDELRGGNGKDSLFGGKDDDAIYGGSGDDRLYGEANNDKLFGYSDDDKLYGGDGLDRLNGGSGDDILSGGADRDIFVFNENMDNDTIIDFDVMEDLLKFNFGTDVSFDEFMTNARNDGDNLVFLMGANSLVLENVSLEDITVDHFLNNWAEDPTLM